MEFFETIEKRRTHYNLGKNGALNGDQIEALVKEVLFQAPAAFNQANQEVVLLLGEAHDQYWNITEEVLRKVVGDGDFAPTVERLKGFHAAQGTLLIYEDVNVVKELQKAFPLYEEGFPEWSTIQSGMFQIMMWDAFTAKGMGANLLHYNPLVDAEVAKTLSIPSHWRLAAQMTFGEPLGEEEDHTHPSVEGRFRRFN